MINMILTRILESKLVKHLNNYSYCYRMFDLEMKYRKQILQQLTRHNTQTSALNKEHFIWKTKNAATWCSEKS